MKAKKFSNLSVADKIHKLNTLATKLFAIGNDEEYAALSINSFTEGDSVVFQVYMVLWTACAEIGPGERCGSVRLDCDELDSYFSEERNIDTALNKLYQYLGPFLKKQQRQQHKAALEQAKNIRNIVKKFNDDDPALVSQLDNYKGSYAAEYVLTALLQKENTHNLESALKLLKARDEKRDQSSS